MKFSKSLSFLGLLASLLVIQADDAVIESNIWPNPDDIPSLANGHVGFVLFDDAIALNGLYNGARGESHRARIPNFSNITTPNNLCNQDKCTYTLNMREGFFELLLRESGYDIYHKIYAHRFYNRAIINQVRVERLQAGTFTIPLAAAYGNDSSDLDLKKDVTYNISLDTTYAINLKCYETKVVEDPRYQPLPSKVCVAFTAPPSSIVLEAADQIKEYYHITTIGRTEEDVRKEIFDILNVYNGGGNFFTSHAFAWENFWNRYEISVEGDSNLNKIIHTSMFYLISSLPSEMTNQPKDPFWGLGPGGLSKGTAVHTHYQGHSFWDTEMWMHRPVLLFNPRWSEDIISYRYMVRKAAADNALNTGYQGYRYPWESAYTGAEVTPDCCPEVVEYQHHITADVMFSVRAHWSATRDIEWWEKVGCDIAWNTAKFWESRVRYNTSTQLYDIRNVMGADEDHHDVDNNVFTNVIAAINLFFGDFAGCTCKNVLGVTDADYEKFSKIARSMTLLYDEENDRHPQFEGYDGSEIKQADVALLGYPLLLRMNATTKRNDLTYYAERTRENGPAMTWAMHAIGFLDLRDEVEGAKFFNRSYSVYTREPFKVWSETMPGQPAAGNFITGAGGFLQSVIVGYGGIQLHSDRMIVRTSYLPPGTTNFEFKGITYMGNVFSLKIDETNKIFTLVNFNPSIEIRVTVNGVGQGNLVEGYTLTIPRSQEIILRPTATACPIKKTFINLKAINEPVGFVEDEWTLGSNELPAAFDIPSISNGHVGLVLFGHAIHLNGLYNGAAGFSHRAIIPNFSNVTTSLDCSMNNCAYQLYLKQGYFEKISYDLRKFKVTQQIYAHRFYNRAIINRIVLERIDGTTAESVELHLAPGSEISEDLNLLSEKPDRINGHDIITRCYETKVVEDPRYQFLKSKACISYTVLPARLSISTSQRSSEFVHITAVGRTEEEVKKELFDIFTRENSYASLFEKHASAWEHDMESFGISVTGNLKLNQVIRSSMFYLFSNLPSTVTNQPKDPFYGLSPSGLSKGTLEADYQGHSFWDTEMWMHPPLLLLNPEWSEEILNYRYRVRKAAADNANKTGYEGYRYPWESGFTGVEVTPPCCPEVVEFQHHIVADIAFAFRSHLAATRDINWWKNYGCDIAYNTAKFWESRVEFNETTKLHSIFGVMGPDEFHHDVDNNVYTNVIAAINLYFGDFAACTCQDVLKLDEEDFAHFSKIARSIKLLYDEENDFHPQFEGYDGAPIKQADVVMLGFPLQLPMDESTKRNNLLYYDNVTSDEGPAMTWGMHSIGYLDLKDQEEAAKAFDKAWTTYTHEPFLTWSENQPGLPAAGNFITGAGGFLQSLINGYGGIRLHFDHLSITNFYMPPNSRSLKLNGITYLNNQFSLEIVGRTATLNFTKVDIDKPLKIVLKPSGQQLSTTAPIVFDRDEELVIESMIDHFGSCEMKKTELGFEYGSAGSLKFSIATILLAIFVRLI